MCEVKCRTDDLMSYPTYCNIKYTIVSMIVIDNDGVWDEDES